MAELLLRVAFVNQSRDTSVTVHVVTEDTVESCELLTTTPATLPEQASGIVQGPGGFDLEVPAGKILGFVTKHQVAITNPNSAIVATVYASGKDPWPQPPPPPPPLLAGVSDYNTRYANFLLGGGAPSAAPTPVVMVICAA